MYIRSSRIFNFLITVLLTTIITYFIIYLFLDFYNIDIFSLTLHPIFTFFSLLGINAIKWLVTEIVEKLISTRMPAGSGNQPQGWNQSIADPTGVSLFPYINPYTKRPYQTYQPYATNLANRLDSICHLYGGRVSPPYNDYLSNRDRLWLYSYYIGNDKNPILSQNSSSISNDIRILP